MICIRPYEWLHCTIQGRGSAGKTRLNGTLYITPHRMVIQTGNGPEWSANIKDITVQSKDTIRVQDGRQLKWSSKNSWWTEAIKFWRFTLHFYKVLTYRPSGGAKRNRQPLVIPCLKPL